MAVVLALDCPERGGVVRRTVVDMPRDLRLWLEITKLMDGVPNFLSKSYRKNAEMFLDQRNRFFLIDDVGVAAVLLEKALPLAHVHITFWDRKLRGREELCKRLCDYVMFYMELDQLHTAIPKTSVAVQAFAKRIGFRQQSEFGEYYYFVY